LTDRRSLARLSVLDQQGELEGVMELKTNLRAGGDDDGIFWTT
jgi:hypothetical protein